jgi:hypothetical protein
MEDGKLQRENMNALIRKELEHIPRGMRRSPQNEFRWLYPIIRRKHLSKSATIPRDVTLVEAISSMRKSPRHEEFEPEYDRDYFASVNSSVNASP